MSLKKQITSFVFNQNRNIKSSSHFQELVSSKYERCNSIGIVRSLLFFSEAVSISHSESYKYGVLSPCKTLCVQTEAVSIPESVVSYLISTEVWNNCYITVYGTNNFTIHQYIQNFNCFVHVKKCPIHCDSLYFCHINVNFNTSVSTSKTSNVIKGQTRP